MEEIFVASLLSIALGYWLSGRRYSKRLLVLEATNSDLKNQLFSVREEVGKASLEEFKNSDEFCTRLSLEYSKGKEDGAAEELKKFQLTYTPVVIDHENFITHKVDIGYDMQLHYSGFPIGEPTRRITHHKEKSKDENIKMLLSAVDSLLNTIQVAANRRIPITVNKTPKRENPKRTPKS